MQEHSTLEIEGESPMCTTHEAFISNVAAMAKARVNGEERERLESIKLVYGAGQAGLRGVTYYGRWQNGKPDAIPFVEVCALGQEHWIQVAGTTIHELAHVLAGHEAGHGKAWRDACQTLGLRKARAAGHRYMLAGFDPDIRFGLADMAKPDEGEPVADLLAGLGGMMKLKPCPAGIGTRGRKSRGTGSGSRLRRFVCECVPPVIIRAGRDDLHAHCDDCGCAFHQTH